MNEKTLKIVVAVEFLIILFLSLLLIFWKSNPSQENFQQTNQQILDERNFVNGNKNENYSEFYPSLNKNHNSIQENLNTNNFQSDNSNQNFSDPLSDFLNSNDVEIKTDKAVYKYGENVEYTILNKSRDKVFFFSKGCFDSYGEPVTFENKEINDFCVDNYLVDCKPPTPVYLKPQEKIKERWEAQRIKTKNKNSNWDPPRCGPSRQALSGIYKIRFQPDKFSTLNTNQNIRLLPYRDFEKDNYFFSNEFKIVE